MNRITVFIVITLCLLVITCLHFYLNIFDNVGYVYPLDDTYIHLAIAKNFVNNCIWGVTLHDFSSSSSSPLFVLIISAIIFIFGNHSIIPFFLNIILAVSLLYLIFFYVNHQSGLVIAVLSSVIVYISIPISANIYNGMEHLLHSLFTLIFILLYVHYLKFNYLPKSLYFIALLLVATRYESIFLISVVAIFEMCDKKFRTSVMLLVYASIPIILFGLISVLNGDMFLPYSVLLKGDIPINIERFMEILFAFYDKLAAAPHLAGLLIFNLLSGFYAIIKFGFRSICFKLIMTALAVTILHLLFAKVGWVYRYEAYLVAIHLIAIFHFLTENLKVSVFAKYGFLTIFIMVMIPLSARYIESLNHIPVMSKNINDQQITMSEFLQKYYNNSPVILNDIGACCYYTNIYLTDLVGIADRDIVNLRLNKQFQADKVDELIKSRKSQIAIIYSQGFADLIPSNWTIVATMTIQNNIGCAYDTVTFFSISQDIVQTELLRKNLLDFIPKISNDISIRIQ